jgi:hypothetical protein
VCQRLVKSGAAWFIGKISDRNSLATQKTITARIRVTNPAPTPPAIFTHSFLARTARYVSQPNKTTRPIPSIKRKDYQSFSSSWNSGIKFTASLATDHLEIVYG